MELILFDNSNHKLQLEGLLFRLIFWQALSPFGGYFDVIFWSCIYLFPIAMEMRRSSKAGGKERKASRFEHRHLLLWGGANPIIILPG